MDNLVKSNYESDNIRYAIRNLKGNNIHTDSDILFSVITVLSFASGKCRSFGDQNQVKRF